MSLLGGSNSFISFQSSTPTPTVTAPPEVFNSGDPTPAPTPPAVVSSIVVNSTTIDQAFLDRVALKDEDTNFEQNVDVGGEFTVQGSPLGGTDEHIDRRLDHHQLLNNVQRLKGKLAQVENEVGAAPDPGKLVVSKPVEATNFLITNTPTDIDVKLLLLDLENGHTNLDSRISPIETTLASGGAISTKIDTNTNNLATLTTGLSTANSNVETIQTSLTGITTKITDLETKTAPLTTDTTTITIGKDAIFNNQTTLKAATILQDTLNVDGLTTVNNINISGKINLGETPVFMETGTEKNLKTVLDALSVAASASGVTETRVNELITANSGTYTSAELTSIIDANPNTRSTSEVNALITAHADTRSETRVNELIEAHANTYTSAQLTNAINSNPNTRSDADVNALITAHSGTYTSAELTTIIDANPNTRSDSDVNNLITNHADTRSETRVNELIEAHANTYTSAQLTSAINSNPNTHTPAELNTAITNYLDVTSTINVTPPILKIEPTTSLDIKAPITEIIGTVNHSTSTTSNDKLNMGESVRSLVNLKSDIDTTISSKLSNLNLASGVTQTTISSMINGLVAENGHMVQPLSLTGTTRTIQHNIFSGAAFNMNNENNGIIVPTRNYQRLTSEHFGKRAFLSVHIAFGELGLVLLILNKNASGVFELIPVEAMAHRMDIREHPNTIPILLRQRFDRLPLKTGTNFALDPADYPPGSDNLFDLIDIANRFAYLLEDSELDHRGHLGVLHPDNSNQDPTKHGYSIHGINFQIDDDSTIRQNQINNQVVQTLSSTGILEFNVQGTLAGTSVVGTEITNVIGYFHSPHPKRSQGLFVFGAFSSGITTRFCMTSVYLDLNDLSFVTANVSCFLDFSQGDVNGISQSSTFDKGKKTIANRDYVISAFDAAQNRVEGGVLTSTGYNSIPFATTKTAPGIGVFTILAEKDTIDESVKINARSESILFIDAFEIFAQFIGAWVNTSFKNKPVRGFFTNEFHPNNDNWALFVFGLIDTPSGTPGGLLKMAAQYFDITNEIVEFKENYPHSRWSREFLFPTVLTGNDRVDGPFIVKSWKSAATEKTAVSPNNGGVVEQVTSGNSIPVATSNTTSGYGAIPTSSFNSNLRVTNQVVTNTSTLSGLNTQVTTLETNLTTLGTNFTTLDNQINTASTGIAPKVTQLETDFTTLNNQINTASTGIAPKVTQLETDFTTLNTQINTAVIGIAPKLSTLETSVGFIDNQINNNPSGIAFKVTALETAVDDRYDKSTSDSRYPSITDFNTLNTNFTTHKTNFDGLDLSNRVSTNHNQIQIVKGSVEFIESITNNMAFDAGQIKFRMPIFLEDDLRVRLDIPTIVHLGRGQVLYNFESGEEDIPTKIVNIENNVLLKSPATNEGKSLKCDSLEIKKTSGYERALTASDFQEILLNNVDAVTGNVSQNTVMVTGPRFRIPASPNPIVFVDSDGRLGSGDLSESIYADQVFGASNRGTDAEDSNNKQYEHGLVPTYFEEITVSLGKKGFGTQRVGNSTKVLCADSEWRSISSILPTLESVPNISSNLPNFDPMTSGDANKFLKINNIDGGTVFYSRANSDEVEEGPTNLFYTNARVDARVQSQLSGGFFTNIVSDIVQSQQLIATSDRRLKTDIVTMKLEESVIDKLRPVNYRFRGKEEQRRGLIAQEVMEADPTLIHRNKDNILGINYPDLISTLILEIKELKKQVEMLKKNIN